MNSSLLKCKVKHSRLIPKKYQFDINYFWFNLNLDEIDQLNNFRYLALNKFNLFNFNQDDYLPRKESTLKERVIGYLQDHGVKEEIKSINLVTSARVLGYVFNPVSFYFIHSENKQYAIIEICNTYKEIKPYFVSNTNFTTHQSFDFTTAKEFYISPFASMKNKMRFRASNTENNLIINIEDFKENNDLELVTSMQGKKVELNDKNLLKYFFKYPFVTVQVILLIHIHALILFLKRIPYYKKSDEQAFQKGYKLWKS